MARRRNLRTTTLTTGEVLERALAKVDEEGLEALTMRRLAHDLGVEAPSLYNHVASKEALLDGILSLMRSEMQLPDEWPDGWIDQLELVLMEYRRVLNAHPNMMPLAGKRLDEETDSGLLYLIEERGFHPDDAVELWQSLVAFVVGFSTFESLYAETDTRGLPPEIGARVVEWRDETVKKTLRMIMCGYESISPLSGLDRPRASLYEPVALADKPCSGSK